MIVKDAGLAAHLATAKPVDSRRQRFVETARLLRAAQTDEEAADALEAAIELSKE